MDLIKITINFLFCSQSRMSWRRITVLAAATALLIATKIDAAAWTTIALCYIAGDSAEKALAAFKK